MQPNRRGKTRLGQVTVGANRDLLLERRVDERFEVVELVFGQTDVGVSRNYNVRLILSKEGLVKFFDMVGRILDSIEGDETIKLPINESEYMTSHRGVSDEQPT